MSDINNLQNWRKAILSLGSSIRQAIYCLESSGMQIVMVVSEGNRLEGTLTDGDIRRAFLGGRDFDSLIDEVLQRNPLAVPPEVNRELVLQLMKLNGVHQLPIVDPSGVVVGLHVLDSIITPSALKNLMVIMAGGKGSRMYPHTQNCPKPMLQVGGKPMIEHIIERAKADGFQYFVISLNYLGHIIEDHFGDGRKFGVSIEYLREDVPLGTAGALSLLSSHFELPFIVTNGDVLTDIHYNEILEFHIKQNAMATMAVRLHEIQNPFGVVRTNGILIEGFEEKPIIRSHINAGIYVLDPSALIFLNKNEYCDMPLLFNRIRGGFQQTIAYPMHEPWLDVGRPEDLIMANDGK